MKSLVKIVALILFSVTCAYSQPKKGVSKGVSKTPVTTSSITADGVFAEFDTNKGKIVVQLEYVKTPITVANFISLAEGKNTFVKAELKGKPFYNGLKFHRVIKEFMIQGGDPLGNGSGDPGYKFKDEFTDLKHSKGGILSMANSGPGTNGSQFFITHKETPWLDGKHTVFGTVISGMDVVNKIEMNDVINKVTIVKNGVGAKAFDGAKVFSNYFSNKAEDEKKEAAIKAKADAEALAIALKQFENSITTASGLKYVVLKEGIGAMPLATSNVKVHYTGSFLNGKVFDSSVQRGTPIDFGLNQVIKGWTEGLQLMREGSKYKFLIPASLAYGERGAGGAIPPNSNLIFEVELIKINQQ